MLFKREYFTSMMYYISILIRADYISLPQLSFGVQHYVNFYNSRRIYSALQYRIPNEVYFGICNRLTGGYSKPSNMGRSAAIKDLWTFTVRYHMEIPKIRNVVKQQKVKSLIA